MKNYETLIIFNSSLEEEAIKAGIEKVTTLIANHEGKVDSVEEWGKRKLAYSINKQSEGYYVLVNFSSNPEFIDELERTYNITDDVVKYIVLNKD